MSKINIGVIGVGRWGPNLVRNFYSQRESHVLCVADRLPTRLKLLQERYPDLTVTENENDIFENSKIDAVVICTPTSTHFELAKKALTSGKHVFLEKPLANTVEECKTLIDLAREKNRVLFVGHIFVYNAGIQAVRRIIQNGELGKIHYIHMTRSNLGPIRTDVNALWDLAPHDLSILRYWLDHSPVKVSAVGGRFLNPKIEDVVFATYTFPQNILANIHVSWLNPKKVREVVIVGEQKMLVWDDMDLNHPIRIYNKKVVMDRENDVVDSFVGFRASIQEGDTVIPRIQLNEPLSAECAAFLAALKDPKKSLSTGVDGLEVVETLVATDRSIALSGAEVSISPLSK